MNVMYLFYLNLWLKKVVKYFKFFYKYLRVPVNICGYKKKRRYPLNRYLRRYKNRYGLIKTG